MIETEKWFQCLLLDRENIIIKLQEEKLKGRRNKDFR